MEVGYAEEWKKVTILAYMRKSALINKYANLERDRDKRKVSKVTSIKGEKITRIENALNSCYIFVQGPFCLRPIIVQVRELSKDVANSS
jgi:hypothetical protein